MSKKEIEQASKVAASEAPEADAVLKLKAAREAKEKEEAALEAVRVRCKVCFKEVAPKRVCGGHGGGGGGGDDAEENSDTEAEDKAFQTADTKETLTKTLEALEALGSVHDTLDLDENEAEFDAEVIADLVARGLLLIDNDRESMTLTMTLNCELSELTAKEKQALVQFMQAVLKEWDAFKAENELPNSCLEVDKDDAGNVLHFSLSLPRRDLYDAFIQRLAARLLPEETLNQAQEADADETENNRPPFNPSPLSTDLY
ncbi:MAG: hypothetical protein P1U32_07145 [Legionellaceae bacterium]|nr:hypothetical protein [Legionellaceae bacterium]